MRYPGLFLLLCSYISVWEICGTAHAPLPHVARYDVVRLRTGRVKRSADLQETYPTSVEYALNIDGKTFTLSLEKNRELLGRNYSLTYYTEDGIKEITYPSNVDHCYYQGHILNINDSSVSVGMCSGMRGFLKAEKQVYLIEPLENSVNGDHAVYKQEHLRTKRATYGYINDTVNDYEATPRLAGLYNSKNMKIKVPREGRYIEMVIVVDHKEYMTYGSLKNVETRMLEVANHVNKLYRPLNIRVMLVGLEVWKNQDQIDVSEVPDHTLDRFLKWRQTHLLPRKKHDNAQFVTAVDFQGSTVGLAPLRSMCYPSSGAVNQDHERSPLGVASTIAHEMGHNLGMTHDTANCDCSKTQPEQNCVMADSIGPVLPESFSSCSKRDLEIFLQNNDVRCLLNVPNEDDLIGGPVCGNAIVEKGEECDCGTIEECENKCCNATTCRLTEGSQCAHGECCNQCKIKQAGSVCRPSAHDCDLEEYCTGKLAQCPKDDYKMNGLPCNSNQGYCYNGECPTHQEHCNLLWGPDADVADDICFNNNCQRSNRCSQENKKCGKIYCSGGNEFPVTKKKSEINMLRTTCKVAVDEHGSGDIGLVPTGTKCGTNKVCYHNTCQDVAVYGTANCSAKCNNHGVCNHERQCHCDPGWAPPFCDTKLYELSSWQDVVIGVTTVIGILLLITIIIGGLMYCKKKQIFSKKRSFMDVNAYPGQCNPAFQPVSAKNSPKCGPPRISQPTFVESSVTQTLFTSISPSRAPPQPPTVGERSRMEQVWKTSGPCPVVPNNINFPQDKPPLSGTKPLPPSRPLPPLITKPVNKPKPPPVPPVKPSSTNPTWNLPQAAAVPKVPLKPPQKFR
ncbi:disintegrin and metalloproteinase domain-containing protein 8a [Clarias gariepinus]